MPRISVIVPAFNAEAYLQACINSVLAQSFMDWELLLIDDGSVDSTPAICRRAAQGDSRVRVIRQENAGVSSARNRGIDLARGEYITFLDADDAYAPEHLGILLRLAEESGADVTATGMQYVDEQGAVYASALPGEGVYTGREEMLRKFLCESRGLYSCDNKLFCSSTVKGLHFKAYTRAEDALFCVEALLRGSVFASGDYATYLYFRRPDSVTHRGVNRRSVDQVLAWEELYALMEEAAPALCPWLAQKLVHDADKLYRQYLSLTPEGSRDCCRLLRRARIAYFPRQYADGRIPPKKVAAAVFYRLSPSLYYRLAGKGRKMTGGKEKQRGTT